MRRSGTKKAKPPSLVQIAHQLDCKQHQVDGIGWLECNLTAPQAVVIFHGVTGGKLDMAPLARDYVARGYAVYMVDLPGHGDSAMIDLTSYDDLAAWCQRAIHTACAGRVPDVIVSNSYASSILYHFMQQGRLPAGTRVILACPTPKISRVSGQLQQLAVRLPSTVLWPLYNLSGVRVVRTAVLLPTRRRQAWRWLMESERNKKHYTTQQTSNQLTTLLYDHNPYRQPLAPAVQRRVTVVMGTKDIVVTPDSPQIMARLLPQAHFRAVPGVGHILHFEAHGALLP